MSEGTTVYTVYPVPRGMTDEEAFAEIDLMGELVEYRWWRPRFHWPFVQWCVMEEGAVDAEGQGTAA